MSEVRGAVERIHDEPAIVAAAPHQAALLGQDRDVREEPPEGRHDGMFRFMIHRGDQIDATLPADPEPAGGAAGVRDADHLRACRRRLDAGAAGAGVHVASGTRRCWRSTRVPPAGVRVQVTQSMN